jgi:hypothetical protein
VGLLTSSSGSGYGGTDQSNVAVDISRATLALSTYALADGTSWLLPTWILSGSVKGSSGGAGSTFSGSVLAVPAKYVHLAPTS